MRDEDFECFISEFGEATARREVPREALEKWRGRLPEQLLTYWQREGWSCYRDGLFWTVDPSDYEEIVNEWLAGSPFPKLDTSYVFARSAFGDLYLCGERSGSNMMINCAMNGIIATSKGLEAKSASERDGSIRAFFLTSEPGDYDKKDASRSPMFARALAKLGPLSEEEMYGFEPALVAGGTNDVSHLRKVKLDQHLTILRQLATPSIPFGSVDVEKLIAK